MSLTRVDRKNPLKCGSFRLFVADRAFDRKLRKIRQISLLSSSHCASFRNVFHSLALFRFVGIAHTFTHTHIQHERHTKNTLFWLFPSEKGTRQNFGEQHMVMRCTSKCRSSIHDLFGRKQRVRVYACVQTNWYKCKTRCARALKMENMGKK